RSLTSLNVISYWAARVGRGRPGQIDLCAARSGRSKIRGNCGWSCVPRRLRRGARGIGVTAQIIGWIAGPGAIAIACARRKPGTAERRGGSSGVFGELAVSRALTPLNVISNGAARVGGNRPGQIDLRAARSSRCEVRGNGGRSRIAAAGPGGPK